MRTSDDELARRVDKILGLRVEKTRDALVVDGLQCARNENLLHVVLNALVHALLVGVEIVVLRAYDDGVDGDGVVVVVILDGHLALAVGAQIGHHLALAAYLRQHLQQSVGEVERERHVVGSLIGGVAKHHALVASALVFKFLAIHAAVDVVALLVQGAEHGARIAVEAVLTFGVADAVYHLARHQLKVDVRLAFHLASQNHLTRGDECFASHLRLRVERQQLVQHGIADLVCHLVGMAFGNGFRCKQITHNS